LVAEAHELFKSNTEGQNSNVYPALARVPDDLFGICVAGTSGNLYEAGDDRHEFSIMSVSKPFVFALVCQTMGAQAARERLGVNATGLAFNSLAAVEQGDDGRTNPMVNSGPSRPPAWCRALRTKRGGGSSTRGCLASRGGPCPSTTRSMPPPRKQTTATRG